MPFHHHLIRHTAKFGRKHGKQLVSILARLRTPALKERPHFRFQQFDSQALRGDSHLYLVLELLEIGHLPDRLLQFIFQLRHIVFSEREVLTRSCLVGARLLRSPAWVFEISPYRLLHFFTAVQQPKYYEQRHHRRHEIGVGHLPCTTVMAAVATFLLIMMIGFAGSAMDEFYADVAAAAAAAASPPPRQAFSSSWNEGRTCPGTL